MKTLQIVIGTLALAAAGLECYYLIGIGRWSTNKQLLTALLYIGFFWILWGYARIANYISPALVLNGNLIKLLATVVVVAPPLMVIIIGSTSNVAHADMMKFGVLNGAIMACYLLVAVVAIFGDKWLGFVAKLLKLGREFPRADAG